MARRAAGTISVALVAAGSLVAVAVTAAVLLVATLVALVALALASPWLLARRAARENAVHDRARPGRAATPGLLLRRSPADRS